MCQSIYKIDHRRYFYIKRFYLFDRILKGICFPSKIDSLNKKKITDFRPAPNAKRAFPLLLFCSKINSWKSPLIFMPKYIRFNYGLTIYSLADIAFYYFICRQANVLIFLMYDKL